MNDFDERCLKAGCLIAPIRMYSQYDSSGNVDESSYEGTFYEVFEFDGNAVGPDYYVQIERYCHIKPKYKTKEAALLAYEKEMNE